MSVTTDTLVWAGLSLFIVYVSQKSQLPAFCTTTCHSPKHWSSFHWKTSPATFAPNGITVYLNLTSSVLKVIRYEEALSSCWCQYPFLQTQTFIIHASAIKWTLSFGVLKWHHSLTIALFEFVGSKQTLSFRLPDLSLPSTRTKLLIHGVASCTGLSTLACSILFISGWKAYFR